MLKTGKIDECGFLYIKRKRDFKIVMCCKDKSRVCSDDCVKFGDPSMDSISICGSLLVFEKLFDERKGY